MEQRTCRSLERGGKSAPLPAAPTADEYIKGAIISLQSALISYRRGRARDALEALRDARLAVTSARIRLNEERGRKR